MSLYLKIDNDAAFNFFESYDRLSPLRQKIWQLTRWWVNRFPVAKPSQSKIAEKAGCSRSAVSEAFRIYKSLGWMYLTSRGFKRSKIIGIPKHLLQMDLFNREYFKRVEATYRATHSYSKYKKITSKKAGTLQIPFYLQKLNISLDAKLKLSLVPQSIYQSALESAKADARKGKKVLNEERYLVGVALRMAQKQGVKLDWRAYYGAIAA